MTQRTWAALLAVPLIMATGIYCAFSALPFVTYAPGPTFNVLGDNAGKPIVEVQGHKTYPDTAGQLRMTTVSVTERTARLDLFTLLNTWRSRDDAIYPFAIQYGTTGSSAQDQQAGQVEMIGSQDDAIAAALRQLGYHVSPDLEILSVTPGMPAAGKLKVRDVIRRFAGHRVTAATNLGRLIAAVPPGHSAPMTVLRQNKLVTVRLTPRPVQGHKLIGVTLGVGYRFPFKVAVNISDTIGGPSAGLMFALSIYDTLTPGSLTNGGHVAGTGTISLTGQVGEIGGIQQKIAGARADGAQLFLVPPANCPDAITSDHGSMRLAKASSLKVAIHEVQAWGRNHQVALPQCTAPHGTAS